MMRFVWLVLILVALWIIGSLVAYVACDTRWYPRMYQFSTGLLEDVESALQKAARQTGDE